MGLKSVLLLLSFPLGIVLLVTPDCVIGGVEKSTEKIVIGTEYITTASRERVEKTASLLSPLKLKGSKILAENIAWGEMQSGPDASIDFTKLDWFIDVFQSYGHDNLTLPLKHHSEWASKDVTALSTGNPAPNRSIWIYMRNG